MNLEIKIIKGNSVLELLTDSAFISQWQALANQCDKVTVIQEPPFVITWYCQYFNRFQPILILGYDNASNLVGLIPLAYSLDSQYLSHAGDHQAEYHGWLSKKDIDQEFLIQALIAVKHNFPLRIWQWRPLPPGAQTDWIYSSDLKHEKIFVRITEIDSPILDLNDETKIKKLKTKALSNQINRYKKRNSFYIERVRSKEKAIELFDILAVQCDFRQMAVHQTTPFGSDANKKPFYIELLNYPENNHFTILWSGNIPVAFHFGACDSETVYLGLSAYNPVEEKNSPGSVLIIKLIELLREEGFKYIDLTPGGDKYKEKYSTFRQKLYVPIICFSKKDKIKSDINYFVRKAIKNSIFFLAKHPNNIKNKLNKVLDWLRKIKNVTFLEKVKVLNSIIYNRTVFIIYKVIIDDQSLINTQTNEIVDINKYSDLMLYSDSNSGLKKTDLLSRALKHFQSEDILFTIIKNGVLAQYAWMAKGGKSHKLVGIDMEFDSPENSVILYDFFTEPCFNTRQLTLEILENMLTECRKNNAKEVLIILDSENSILIKSIIEKSEFKIYSKFQKTNVLWFVQKTRKTLL